MKIVTQVSVSFSTLTVFDPLIVGREHSNKITQEYCKQGFSWRKGNIDFYTIDSLGVALEVLYNETVKISSSAIWAVQVPFTVISTFGISIQNSPYDYETEDFLPISPGEYALIFEQSFMPDWDRTNYYGNNKAVDEQGLSLWGRLWFNEAKNVQAKILLPGSHDLKLCPHYLDAVPPLKLDAEPLTDSS